MVVSSKQKQEWINRESKARAPPTGKVKISSPDPNLSRFETKATKDKSGENRKLEQTNYKRGNKNSNKVFSTNKDQEHMV